MRQRRSIARYLWPVAWFAFSVSALASPPPPPPPPPGYGSPPPPPPGYATPPPDPEMVRDGLVLGLGLGPGIISDSSCDGCDSRGGLSLQGQLGGMILPTLAIVGDASIVLHGDDDFALSHGVLAVAAQWWVLPKLWLKGGLGVGHATYTWKQQPEIRETRRGAGALLAGGIEFIQSDNFTLDVQLRIVFIGYREDPQFPETTLTNTSIHLGFNWY